MMPMPTPAANRAVRAPALAMRSALSMVKKYGDAQNAKNSDQQAPQHEDAAVAQEDEHRDAAGHVAAGGDRRRAGAGGPGLDVGPVPGVGHIGGGHDGQLSAFTTSWGTVSCTPVASGSSIIATSASNDWAMSSWNCRATDA